MQPQTKKPHPREREEAASVSTMRANDIGTESFLQHLSKVKRTGADRWIACCPAHDDKTPSLAIRQTADGVVLIRCFAGCAAHEIVAAVGMNLSDLFPPKDFA